MLQTEKELLWRISATFLGMALPAMLFGRTVMFVLIILGAVSGILATKGASLRASVHLWLDSKLLWLIAAILASFAISVFTSLTFESSLDKYGQIWIVALVALSVFLTLREMPGKYLELLFKSLTITAAACSVIAITDAISGYDPLSIFLHRDWFDTPYRLNFYAGALAVILPFVWARMIIKHNEREPFAKMAFKPLLVITLLALIISGGRIGWAASIVAIVSFVLLAKKHHNLEFKLKQLLTTVLICLTGVGGYILAHGLHFFTMRMDLDAGERGFGGGRGDIWQIAWQHSFDQPLFGIGINGFRHLPNNIDSHPHSAPLQLLLETGFIGLILVSVLALYILKTFWSYSQHNLYGVAALSSFLAFCTVSLASTSIFNIWWLAFFTISTLIGWRAGWATSRK